MLRIGICDDENIYVNEIIDCCSQYFQGRKEETDIRKFYSGKEVLEEEELDILFLDIEMPGCSGLEVKNYFQRRASDVRIIFCTSHVESCREAFGKNVFGFLVKPLTHEAFRKRMDDVMYDWQMKNAVVTYESVQGAVAVHIQDIVYVKAAGRYSRILTVQDGREIFCNSKGFGEWKEELEGYGFASCHRSYYVNLAYVKQCSEEVVLTDGSRIPSSRRMKKDFDRAYWDFITDMAH